ncbi:Oidioi.mRNA.OKI2018_I69.PAR.g12227.t1.cds [Oikopleura dioica]|uniref:Oidioi.mRNA.OKI2018_I69.PAR.g12227.t1.cds n=1 Tax=Oikopleura dioica TaxID=34765 RepID=A0ABN7RZM2_OIKDI|nr:Oidioi.mRNA.OKI2018_I69.PAR.g12227.t1.cds [Oikopleura dioica]
MSMHSSTNTRKNSRKNSSVEQNGKLTSKRLQTIKSNKSTEGSKTKDSEGDPVENEDLYVTEGIDDAFYRRIRSWVSEVDKCLRSGDFDRKVVMDPSEMDYPEDPPYSRETSDGLNFRPGNHHTVTVVIADDGS